VEDKIKQIFQRKSQTTSAQTTDAMAKGRKIALAVGIGFFVLFTIPFVVALFGSDDLTESRFFYMAAQNHFDAQQYDSAYTEYRRALALDPEYTEAMVGYGRCLFVRNERDSAVLIFDRALAVNPDYGEATYRKAQVYYDQKKYGEATTILTPLLIDEPEFYYAMLVMGDCYYALDNYVDALVWYENAYENGGIRGSDLCYIMGYIYETKQENARAIELYKEALTYDDSIVDIYKRLGQLLPGDEGNAYRAKAIELQR
jgi:tetratricopeptide (TPR) repeat protein